ncbi:MAG: hypothetical protein JWM33_1823, partial [Caulobacteraceae bacterium]|nr:hypothetical protein [Caulobacteraceae bacterium]
MSRDDAASPHASNPAEDLEDLALDEDY